MSCIKAHKFTWCLNIELRALTLGKLSTVFPMITWNTGGFIWDWYINKLSSFSKSETEQQEHLFQCTFIEKIVESYSIQIYKRIRHGLRDKCIIILFIKWSGISPYFVCLWLAETAFTGVYLRVSTPQTAFSGVFGVSIFSHARLTSVGAINN